ncbi:MAG TPA: DNA (cytosine-5-)-methyltransferase, partial [Bacteroidales bacterium]|nr:DNA (cytosine-5-)-methyltransferase [Bacteroidales bacterium]
MDNNKKYNVLDLFCGCGGISEGFRMAGYNIIGGIDIDKDATDTFAKNFIAAKVICSDITKIINEEINSYYHNVDIIVGGPPCQGFSSANRWQKERDDPRNKLFFEYLRFVEVLRPKVVLIENVQGLLTRDNGYAKKRITSLLNDMNYSISMDVLNASDYGVPQNRKRAIIIAINTDFCTTQFDFDKIVKLPKVTIDEALSDIYGFEKQPGKKTYKQTKAKSAYQELMKNGTKVLFDHEVKYPAEIVQKRISFVPQ